MDKRIHIGADHAGYDLKEKIKRKLPNVQDHGAYKYEKADDYPDYAKKVCKSMKKGDFGILFCGSAEGMCIAANKIKGIRAIVATDEKIAELSRKHNDANVLCLPGGKMRKQVKGIGITEKQAMKVINTFLKTEFSQAERHKRRLKKIKKIEQ